MFLPGVSLKVKLTGLVVLAVLVFSLVGTGLEAVNQVMAEGTSQPGLSRDRFASSLGNQDHSSDDDNAVIGGLKFICPFH